MEIYVASSSSSAAVGRVSGERIPPGSVSATPAARHSIMSRGKMPAALWTYKDSRRDIIHSRIAGSFRPPRIKINNIKCQQRTFGLLKMLQNSWAYNRGPVSGDSRHPQAYLVHVCWRASASPRLSEEVLLPLHKNSTMLSILRTFNFVGAKDFGSDILSDVHPT